MYEVYPCPPDSVCGKPCVWDPIVPLGIVTLLRTSRVPDLADSADGLHASPVGSWILAL